MALKKQLRDTDGNIIYPDVGLDLDNVIYGADPEEVEEPSPWIETDDIKDGVVTPDKIEFSDSLIRVRTATFQATSDDNGFYAVPTSILTPSDGFVLAAFGVQNGFYLPFVDTGSSRFTVRQLQWDLTNVGSQTQYIRIFYVK